MSPVFVPLKCVFDGLWNFEDHVMREKRVDFAFCDGSLNGHGLLPAIVEGAYVFMSNWANSCSDVQSASLVDRHEKLNELSFRNQVDGSPNRNVNLSYSLLCFYEEK